MNSSGESIFKSRILKLSLGLLIGATLLYLSARDVRWTEVEEHLNTITSTWVLLALWLYWMELGLRVVRWRLFLSEQKPPPPGNYVIIAFFSGYAANNVLPAKLGEAFRADLLGRLANSSRLMAFGSIIAERLFDLVTILVMTAWGVGFATIIHQDTLESVTRGLSLLSPPVLLLTVVIYFLVIRKNVAVNLKLEILTEKVRNLMEGLHALRKPAIIPYLIGSTILIWLLNSLGMWSILMALGIELNVNQTLLLIGLTGIFGAIPAAPAGIGTLQYAFHLAAVMFGFPVSAALVASTIVQVVLLGSATMAGATTYSYAVSHHLLGRKGTP